MGKALGLLPNTKRRKLITGCWWFMPVILAIQEAEMRRIVVRSQPGKIVLQDPISKNPSQK
jgi:hypothetical protein